MKDFLLKVAVPVVATIVIALGKEVIESWPTTVCKFGGGNPIWAFVVAAYVVTLAVLSTVAAWRVVPRELPDSAERGRERAESYVAFATMCLVSGMMLCATWLICGWILLDWPVPKWFGLRTGFFSPASQAAMAACWPDGLILPT